MASLRNPYKGEQFELSVELAITAENVIELLDASFTCPEASRGQAKRTSDQLMRVVGEKLAEQGVDFSEDRWTFDRLKVWSRPRRCAYGLVLIQIDVTAEKL